MEVIGFFSPSIFSFLPKTNPIIWAILELSAANVFTLDKSEILSGEKKRFNSIYLFKFKVCAGDRFSLFERVENSVGNKENAGYYRSFKVRICVEMG